MVAKELAKAYQEKIDSLVQANEELNREVRRLDQERERLLDDLDDERTYSAGLRERLEERTLRQYIVSFPHLHREQWRQAEQFILGDAEESSNTNEGDADGQSQG